MATELEVTKKQFYSQYNSLGESDSNMFIEDCQFEIFTNIMEDAGEFDSSPVVSRAKGVYKRANWRLLGYSQHGERVYEDDLDLEDEVSYDSFTSEWRFSIINGFFSKGFDVKNAEKTEITKSINEGIKFIEKTLDRDLINDISEARQLQLEILNRLDSNTLDRIDLYIITDKVIKQDVPEKFTLDNGFEINIYFWDLGRWNIVKRSKSKRVPISIDFNKEEYSMYNVDYVKMKVDSTLSQYLAIFPADLIADLYKRHRTKILENNVRVFLSAKRKANLAIRNTLRSDENKLFFSFNNGLSVTANRIEIENGKIQKIDDFQIVNGGQTTATIHYANEKDTKKDGSRISLENVFVPVKITEINKEKNNKYGNIVSNISKAANTQSAVKASDFYANDLFLVKIERLAHDHPVNTRSGKNKFYFFERMTGQYNVIKSNQGKTGSSKVRAWEKERPKEFKFNKIDIARWYNCFYGFPHIAAASAEKQFESFMKNKNFEKKDINSSRFKTIIGYGMVFTRIRKLVGTKTGKEYPSIIGDSSVGMSTTIYASTVLNKLSDGKIDYWKIYNHEYDLCKSLEEKKRYNGELDKILIPIIKESWKQLKSFGKTSVQEQTKKIECWEFFEKNFKLDQKVINTLEKFLISDDEKQKRDSDFTENEDSNYFNSLNILLKDDCKVLQNLHLISSRESNYRGLKHTISNTLKKILNQESIITKAKVDQIFKLYSSLKIEKYTFDEKNNSDFKIDFEINKIYNLIFKDYKSFILEIGNKIIELDNIEENITIHDSIKEIKEKLDREYGLSIEDFRKLDSCIQKLETLSIL